MSTTADRVQRGVKGFAAEMREQGIHVGLGSPPICVVDHEAWPCTHELVAGTQRSDDVDYGLGTFKGEPLVLWAMSNIYHRHNHNGRIGCVTFTEDFARTGLEARPCRVCWPAGSPAAP